MGPGGWAWRGLGIANSRQGSGTNANILNAACRVATFLHYVKTAPGLWSAGGMCVHADSGGSGGLADALVWYGEAQDLNKVLMENRPVFSRIDLGCEVPNNNTTAVCAPNTTQTGCNTVTWPTVNGNPIQYSLEYITQDAGNVNLWTGNPGPACANGSGTQTTYNQPWCEMSVLGSRQNCGSQPVAPSFNYPNTMMSAWLCQSAKTGPLNNSTAQGQEFFANFLQQSQAGNQMSLNGVVCRTSEDIEEGTTTYNGKTYDGQSGRPLAYQALIDDMINRSATACAAPPN